MGGAGQGGFALLEGLLAAVLLAVGILGTAGLQVASLAARGRARARLEAQLLAVSALEQAGFPVPVQPGRFRLEWTGLEAAGGTGVRVRVAWAGGPDRCTLARLQPAGSRR